MVSSLFAHRLPLLPLKEAADFSCALALSAFLIVRQPSISFSNLSFLAQTFCVALSCSTRLGDCRYGFSLASRDLLFFDFASSDLINF